MDEEDEFQSQDVEDDDNWEQEVKDRRGRLFQEEVEEPQIPRGRIPNDESTDLDAFKQEVDSDMDEWASSVMQRRREADERIPPPKPPKIEGDFSVFPSVPFRKIEQPKIPFSLPLPVDCPSASVVCDSVSASKSKCGFGEYIASSPPKIYLRQVITYSISASGGTCAVSGSFVTTRDYVSSTCVLTNVCTSGSYTRDEGTLHESGNWVSDGAGGCHWSSGRGPLWCGIQSCDAVTETATNHHQNCHATGIYTGSDSYDEQLSNEYTTALLKSNTIAALPAYPGTYASDCDVGAVYNLSDDEESFTVRREKYKIQFSAAACAGMVVTWKEHFVASPSGTVTDTNKTFTCSGGETETGVYTIPDPTVNGTTTITSIVVDCSDCPKKQMVGEVDA